MRGRARLLAVVITIGLAVAATAAGTAATADRDDSRGGDSVRERLTGYEEDPLVLSTTGTGQVRLRIDDAKQEIAYRLSYTGLEGTVTQAHIHFGGKAQSGGIAVFLCSNLANPPAGTPACPPAPGTVSGTLGPASVGGPANQGIAPGEFAEFVAAIRAGVTYANVHSTKYPGGEIRAQLGHHH
jgi:CHRD domain